MSAVALDSPYKGLRPFEATADDARLFFGRERERELIAANLVAARLTVLYGESGVGKSSVLRAGVVQSLREQARAGAGFAVALYSGWSEADPIDGIADAVRDAVADVLGSDPGPGSGTLAERLAAWAELVAGDVYLVLDQVDEYFLYHGWHGGPLLDELPELVTRPGLRVNVLLGIREDALARLDVFKARIPQLFANQLRLDRLGAQAARAAIVGPLERWRELEGRQMEIEPPLVDAILASVTVAGAQGNGGGPAAIEPPYLQIVMERLWEAEREAGSDVLRLETLDRLGGGRRIVAEHLDRSLAGLSAGEQDTAAEMFSQLVTPSGAKVAYDVADLAGYSSADEAQVRHVAETLVAERILRPVTGSGESARVEIYHDVLASAAAEWRRRHDAERALQAERRRHRRVLVVAVVALLALGAITAVAVYATVQARNASDSRRDAGAFQQAAQALFALPTDPVEALRNAVDASKRSNSPAVADILRTVLLGVRQTRTYGDGSTPVTAAAFLGGRVVTGDARGRVIVYRPEASTERVLHVRAPVTSLSTAPGDLVLATAGDTATLFSEEGGRRPAVRLATMRPGGAVGAAGIGGGRVVVAGARTVDAYHAHGRRLWQTAFRGPARALVVGDERVLLATATTARLLDAATGKQVARFTFPRRDALLSAAYSERLGLVATGHEGHTARLWDARTGELIAQLGGHRGQVKDVAFSRLGPPTLATASTDGAARVWSATRRPELISTLSGHTNQVTSVAFGGNEIVTTSTDRTARVWSRDGQTLAVLAGHRQPPTGAELHGPTALTWSADGTARTWRWRPDPPVTPVGAFSGKPGRAAIAPVAAEVAALTDGEGELVSGRRQRYLRAPALGPVHAVAASADGGRVATGNERGAAIWNVATFNRQGVLATGAPVTLVALGADGGLLAMGGAGGRLQLQEGGNSPRTIATGLGRLVAGAVSPDGRYVGAGDATGNAAVWEVASGKRVAELTGHRAAITGMSFSADSRLVATASFDHDARVWETATGRLLHRLGHFAVASDVAFSPNGHWIVTAGPQRAVLWDVRSGNAVLKLAGNGRFLAVAFSPDGLTIRTVDAGGTIGSYRCTVCADVDAVRATAEARLARLSG